MEQALKALPVLPGQDRLGVGRRQNHLQIRLKGAKGMEQLIGIFQGDKG
jgi:hypothetical protein